MRKKKDNNIKMIDCRDNYEHYHNLLYAYEVIAMLKGVRRGCFYKKWVSDELLDLINRIYKEIGDEQLLINFKEKE